MKPLPLRAGVRFPSPWKFKVGGDDSLDAIGNRQRRCRSPGLHGGVTARPRAITARRNALPGLVVAAPAASMMQDFFVCALDNL